VEGLIELPQAHYGGRPLEILFPIGTKMLFLY